MKIHELYEASDEDVRDDIREILLRDFGEKIEGELSKKEIDFIASGDELWELTLDDVEDQRTLEMLDRKHKFRFAYVDGDSGLSRIYSASKQKLINLLKSFYRNFTNDDLKELEKDHYLTKVR